MTNYLTYNTDESNSIVGCAISQCGNYLAFNSDTYVLRIISLASIRSDHIFREENPNLNERLKCLFEAQLLSPIRCLEFGNGCISRSRLPHRSNKRRASYCSVDNVCLLAVGLQNGSVRIYSLYPSILNVNGNLNTIVEYGERAILILKDGIADLTTVSFSLDGSLRLASASVDGKIRLWDMWDDGNMYKLINVANNFRPYSVSWGNKSRQICVVGSIGKGFIYQSEKPCLKVASLSVVHYNDISSCKYTSDDSLLATCSFDTSVVIWCGGTYKPMLQIWHTGSKPSKIFMGGSHSQFLRDFSFSLDCVDFVSISDDGKIRVWNIEDSKEPVQEIQVYSLARQMILTSVKFHPDGTKYFVTCSDGKMMLVESPCESTQSLANLCRKSVRERLVRRVNQLVQLPNLSTIDPTRSPIRQSSRVTPPTRSNSLLETESFLDQMAPTESADPLASPSSSLSNISAVAAAATACSTNSTGAISSHDIRRFSESDILKSGVGCSLADQNLLVGDFVDELPLPNALKHYLQFGLPGTSIMENFQPRPSKIRFSANRRMSMY